jgi:hypothetical protein
MLIISTAYNPRGLGIHHGDSLVDAGHSRATDGTIAALVIKAKILCESIRKD